MAVRNTKFHAPAWIARARWHFDGRPSLVGRHRLVDGCKWRQPRSLWHGLATSSTPTVRPASELCAERSPSAQRSVRSLSELGDVAGRDSPPGRGERTRGNSRRPWNPGGSSARTTAHARRRYSYRFFFLRDGSSFPRSICRRAIVCLPGSVPRRFRRSRTCLLPLPAPHLFPSLAGTDLRVPHRCQESPSEFAVQNRVAGSDHSTNLIIVNTTILI